MFAINPPAQSEANASGTRAIITMAVVVKELRGWHQAPRAMTIREDTRSSSLPTHGAIIAEPNPITILNVFAPAREMLTILRCWGHKKAERIVDRAGRQQRDERADQNHPAAIKMSLKCA